MQIARQFKTLKAAESFQNRLYDKYNTVRLVRFPVFSEEGQYMWEVSDK